jgi:16S rRNA (cytidine1402-2'-O)-methyltransferase
MNENDDNRQHLPEKPHYSTHPGQRARVSMIATPIGNLGDLGERALRALEGVEELWCEDTRHTQALLNALGVERKRLKRVDQHSADSELRALLRQVEESGLWVGVVTDAGTPGLSDPGSRLIQLGAEFPGIRFEPIPGPSALSAFVSVAGLAGNSFSFLGFFPRSPTEALQLLKEMKESSFSPNWIFFESPNRIRETIGVLRTFCEDLEIPPEFVLAKELTKVHETLYRGCGPGFLTWMEAQGFDERGEWVLAVILPKESLKKEKDQSDWRLVLECLLESGISAKTASQVVVGRFSVAKNLAYKAALDFQKFQKK